ncbi:MAG: cytochrome d ubiquinol oxidase subunit II [Pseudomonadota bacterium]
MPELMIPDLTTQAGWLPLAFMAMMGIAILAYVILDGYDLGVGILLPLATDAEKDLMIASIGPIRQANDTWLVPGHVISLVAFPMAHGVILTALYLPVALMLIGLTLRGVAFDFRVKAHYKHKASWNRAFFAGSFIAAMAQGYMLGQVVLGFKATPLALAFSVAIGLGLVAGYTLLGGAWLTAKTSGALQRKAIRWARNSVVLTGIGVAAVSIATPILSEAIFEKWFSFENLLVVWPIPMVTAALFFMLWRTLGRLPVRLDQNNEYGIWVPFACTAGLFLLAFHGIAYSLFPWLVIDELTIWDSASAPESLLIKFVGAVIVLPIIVAYSVFAYRVFGGKAKPLEYY